MPAREADRASHGHSQPEQAWPLASRPCPACAWPPIGRDPGWGVKDANPGYFISWTSPFPLPHALWFPPRAVWAQAGCMLTLRSGLGAGPGGRAPSGVTAGLQQAWRTRGHGAPVAGPHTPGQVASRLTNVRGKLRSPRNIWVRPTLPGACTSGRSSREQGENQ